MSIHTAEISNLRDFPRPRPTLHQVWVRRGGGEEEKHSSCQADGMRWCLIQATKSLLDTQSPWCLGLLKVCDLSALLFELVSAVMTYCNVPTYPGVKKMFSLDSFFWKCLHSTNSFKSQRHQKRHFPRYTWLTCTDRLARTKRTSEVQVFLSLLHLYIRDNKMEYVPFDACITSGLGNIESTKDDVI